MSIFIAGHNGMVGSALVRKFQQEYPEKRIITKNRSDLDLMNKSAVKDFFQSYKPDEVILAAAKVGGINANNSFPADFIYDNLLMQCNVIDEAFKSGVKKLLFLGSSCIYPKDVQNPIKEEYLLSGHLEPTNEPYAIAKIAGIKICESYNRQYGVDYRSLMPCNLYGPGDNYDLKNSHVIPALIKKFHDAKKNNIDEVSIWGSGKPLREFLHVDDLASGAIFLFNLNSIGTPEMCSHLNIGSGEDISIADLALLIKETSGFMGGIKFDTSMPDGIQKKLLDSSKIMNMGWTPKINLKDGLEEVYSSYAEINSVKK
jgi:nucleoside-diphosphate-sugar epimerase